MGQGALGRWRRFGNGLTAAGGDCNNARPVGTRVVEWLRTACSGGAEAAADHADLGVRAGALGEARADEPDDGEAQELPVLELLILELPILELPELPI